MSSKKVTTFFGGALTSQKRNGEIGWQQGDWKDVDSLLGTMRDCDLHKKFKKFKASTIGSRRRKFGIVAFDYSASPEGLAARAESERKQREAKKNPGKEINELLNKWPRWASEDRAWFKRLLNCDT